MVLLLLVLLLILVAEVTPMIKVVATGLVCYGCGHSPHVLPGISYYEWDQLGEDIPNCGHSHRLDKISIHRSKRRETTHIIQKR